MLRQPSLRYATNVNLLLGKLGTGIRFPTEMALSRVEWKVETMTTGRLGQDTQRCAGEHQNESRDSERDIYSETARKTAGKSVTTRNNEKNHKGCPHTKKGGTKITSFMGLGERKRGTTENGR